MSKLEELIARLCPDGVEYKSLGEVATISRGGNFQKKDFVEQGKPCIHYGQIYTKYGLFADKTFTFIDEGCFAKQKKAQKNDIVMAVTSENIEDVCKCLAWIGDDEVAVSGHSAIIHHTLDPKYLTYFFHSEHFFKQKKKFAHGTKVIEVTPDKLTSIKLPVPPLEVQREIVHILDSYTTSNNELKEQLEKELAARQKQYEWYKRNLIEDISDSRDLFRLKDVASYVRERVYIDTISKKNYVGVENLLQDKKGKTDATTIPSSGNVIGFKKDDILLGNIRPYLKKIWFADIEGGTNGDVLAIRANNRLILPKYLYYILSTDSFFLYDNSHSKGAKMPRGNKEAIMDYEFSLPPLSEQQRVVDILDRFDALCNDITNGLPAEIEARKKQYEYYRDKLLTFKELKKEA